MAILEQEQAKAREEALHQEKLRAEERKFSEALEESKKVCSEIMLNATKHVFIINRIKLSSNAVFVLLEGLIWLLLFLYGICYH